MSGLVTPSGLVTLPGEGSAASRSRAGRWNPPTTATTGRPPADAPGPQVAALLAAPEKSPSAVLTGWPDAPRLHGPVSGLDRVEESVGLILDEVRTDRAFADAGIVRPRVTLARTVLDPAGGGSSSNRHLIARIGQTLLFMLTAMLAGMLLSNEPGYYKAGEYGIRIENLVLIEPRTIAGGDPDRAMLGFETLTFAPIDRDLIVPALLTSAELQWLNAYHQGVVAALAPVLDGDDHAWLIERCAPMA